MVKSLSIIETLVDRLNEINGTGEYLNDLGGRVYRGRYIFDDTDTFPLITIEERVETNDSPDNTIYNRVKVNKQVTIHGIVDVVDSDNPNDSAHFLLSDIKRAIFSKEQRFGGSIITVRYISSTIAAREDSATKIGCSLDLVVTFVDNLSNPTFEV